MISSCTTYISVVLVCVASWSTSATASPAADKPSIANAESRVQELARELANLKKTIRPRHCHDLLRSGQRTSGVYTIFPISKDPLGTDVYCDMQMDGGGWTVFQKRGQYGNNVYYFYRNWTEYANGFGNPAKEYWIGNKVLHVLTSLPEKMQLRVVLRDKNTTAVDYESITIGSEAQQFQLKLGKFLRPSGWDAMTFSNDMKFTTFDRDNDKHAQNCAVLYRGAWWYWACHKSNLNGLNWNGWHASYADGIDWFRHGGYQSFTSVQMMIRPVMEFADKHT